MNGSKLNANAMKILIMNDLISVCIALNKHNLYEIDSLGIILHFWRRMRAKIAAATKHGK